MCILKTVSMYVSMRVMWMKLTSIYCKFLLLNLKYVPTSFFILRLERNMEVDVYFAKCFFFCICNMTSEFTLAKLIELEDIFCCNVKVHKFGTRLFTKFGVKVMKMKKVHKI